MLSPKSLNHVIIESKFVLRIQIPISDDNWFGVSVAKMICSNELSIKAKKVTHNVFRRRLQLDLTQVLSLFNKYL